MMLTLAEAIVENRHRQMELKKYRRILRHLLLHYFDYEDAGKKAHVERLVERIRERVRQK